MRYRRPRIGNCGFTVAPVRPEARDYIMHTRMRVDGMFLAALRAGIHWQRETILEFLDYLDRGLGLNVGVMLGFSNKDPKVVERS